MPFKSERQRKYLWINNPKIAEKFAEHEKNGKVPWTHKRPWRRQKKGSK